MAPPRARRSRLRLTSALTTIVLVAAAGCSTTVAGSPLAAGGSSSADDTVRSTTGSGGGTGSPTAVSRFGEGPVAGPKYKSDVVLIGTGPDAIKAVSPDGMVWTMDSSAPGVKDLAQGKVMFASAIAVGRVINIKDQGSTRLVTIEPIQLDDLVDGAIADVDQKIDLSKLTPQAFPQGLVADSDKDASFSAPGSAFSSQSRFQDGVFRTATAPPSYPWDPPKAGDKVSAAQWDLNAIHSSKELGLGITMNKADLKVFATVSLETNNLDFTMAGDPSGSSFRAVLSGITGLKLDFQAGLGPGGDPSGQNKKVEAEVPLSFDIPLTGGIAPPGIPVYLRIGYVFSVITALGAKNATVTAHGEYGIDGPIGIRDGSVLTPTISVKDSLLDHLDGISLTPSGLVVAVKFKIQVGVGIPMAMVGPYVFVTASSGILKGSQTAINPDCKFASLDLKAGAGFGIDVSDLVSSIVEKYTKTKIKQSKEKNVLSLHKQQSEPDVAACKIG